MAELSAPVVTHGSSATSVQQIPPSGPQDTFAQESHAHSCAERNFASLFSREIDSFDLTTDYSAVGPSRTIMNLQPATCSSLEHEAHVNRGAMEPVVRTGATEDSSPVLNDGCDLSVHLVRTGHLPDTNGATSSSLELPVRTIADPSSSTTSTLSIPLGTTVERADRELPVAVEQLSVGVDTGPENSQFTMIPFSHEEKNHESSVSGLEHSGAQTGLVPLVNFDLVQHWLAPPDWLQQQLINFGMSTTSPTRPTLGAPPAYSEVTPLGDRIAAQAKRFQSPQMDTPGTLQTQKKLKLLREPDQIPEGNYAYTLPDQGQPSDSSDNMSYQEDNNSDVEITYLGVEDPDYWVNKPTLDIILTPLRGYRLFRGHRPWKLASIENEDLVITTKLTQARSRHVSELHFCIL